MSLRVIVGGRLHQWQKKIVLARTTVCKLNSGLLQSSSDLEGALLVDGDISQQQTCLTTSQKRLRVEHLQLRGPVVSPRYLGDEID